MRNVVGKDQTVFLCTLMSFQYDLITSRLASLNTRNSAGHAPSVVNANTEYKTRCCLKTASHLQ